MSLRRSIVEKLQQKISNGKIIIGSGAGTGLSARSEEAGGSDLIIVYNSGQFRMNGCGSLAGMMPYGNANDIVVEMARTILPRLSKTTPVIAGVCGTDPNCIFDCLLNELQNLGYVGVQNFPTVGLIDGNFRKNLEATGMGYDKEVELIRLAHSKGLLTTPYVFSKEDAVAMTQAGADIIVAHMGLTTGGNIGAKDGFSLDECVSLINEIADAAKSVRDDVMILCHGGPISEPLDAAYVLQRAPLCAGFYGASSMERLPTETAIKAVVEEFSRIQRFK
ncbi:phosphoenolpyruvate hydrolase family protein [Serratia fonticola]